MFVLAFMYIYINYLKNTEDTGNGWLLPLGRGTRWLRDRGRKQFLLYSLMPYEFLIL